MKKIIVSAAVIVVVVAVISVAAFKLQIGQATPASDNTAAALGATSTTTLYHYAAYSQASCVSYITIPAAHTLINVLGLTSTQQSLVLNPADLYITSAPVGHAGTVTYGYASIVNNRYGVFLCLDPGFVSNFPVGGISTGSSVITAAMLLGATSTSPVVGPELVASTVTSGTSSSAAPATSSATYSIVVNYSQFTAEAAQYGYTSVYNSTGTSTVSITVFKFNNSPTMTAAQVIAQLNSLGYRPATLSELYALKNQETGMASVVALGTNLGGGYGYPTGAGTGAAGLGHSAGPFSTSVIKFAAVKK